MPNPLLELAMPIGFGFMNASWPGSPVLGDPQARGQFVAALVYAMEQGVRLFDTADIYAPSWDAMGHNEILLREAVSAWQAPNEEKAQLILATKGGISRSTGESWNKDASYSYLASRVEASLENLGVNEIPLWQHHRLDTHLTLNEQLANLKRLKDTMPIRHIGVSNYSREQLAAALDVLGGPADDGIVSVQNQLSPAYRQQLDVLEVCERNGLAFLPWSPMGGVRSGDSETEVFAAFSRVAASRRTSRFAVAQAWLRSLSSSIVPLPGVTRRESIEDALSAIELRLTEDDLGQLANLPATLPLDDELVRDQPLPAII